jgi:cytochrome c55X
VDYVERVILYGRPGTAMPSWQGIVSETEARWIAQQLLKGFPSER